MGVSFGNVHVHAGTEARAVRAAIIEVYRLWMAAEGFEEVAEAGRGEPTDRAIYLSGDDAARWIGIFDEHIDGAEEKILRAVTRMVSSATRGSALGIWVEHDDVLELNHYRDGAFVDAYSTNPENSYTARNRRQLLAYRGREELWRNLLIPQATPADLRTVWDNPPLFRQDMLAVLAPLFGAEPGWGWGGWRDCRERLEFREGLDKLGFRPIIGKRRRAVKVNPYRAALAAESAQNDPFYPYSALAQAGMGSLADGVAVARSWVALADPDEDPTRRADSAAIVRAALLLQCCQRHADDTDLSTNVTFGGLEYGDFRTSSKYAILRGLHNDFRCLIDNDAYEHLVGDEDTLVAATVAGQLAVLVIRRAVVMAIIWASADPSQPLRSAIPLPTIDCP